LRVGDNLTIQQPAGATRKRAKVPVKSNPAAVLDPIKWASIVSGAALS